jgi:hypothetical protein
MVTNTALIFSNTVATHINAAHFYITFLLDIQQTCIQEVPGSNVRWFTGCALLRFS